MFEICLFNLILLDMAHFQNIQNMKSCKGVCVFFFDFHNNICEAIRL
jgi:hypothetical protein